MAASSQSVTDLEFGSGSKFGTRLLGFGAGAGTSLLILFVLAKMQSMEVEVPPPPIADLKTVVLDEPPPPPPDIASREPPPPTVLDLEPLPSDNVIKIAVAPLTYELPLPDAKPEVAISLDAFRPDPRAGEMDPNHIFQFREVDQTPVATHRQKPDVPYRLISEANSRQPRVIFTMVVTKAGGVRNIQVVESCGSREIDKIVAQALEQWRFRPAINGGQPVNCMVIQSIVIKPPRGGSPFDPL